ncbi:PAS domain S-box-containing protein/diguanylate cyclase (GGDEF)-like protein [Pseudoduganella lurida]|uniref:PAS domain S-box-containing protein/diguanylate cyclase (GGDEF)-like protein n=2 Tax=Pseudoduganella lurida TaxID=1036180 RepID=A0A562RK21_9BURK|nr:PAS domain S-box-containing protein/diguanylate cyclase (GGDEF)-like protein [Pseudoduganella lurida]
MDPGSRSVFVVARADGYLLARVPALPPPERAVRYATTVLAMAGQQVYIESHVAKTDGVERLYAWTRVPGFPLLVCVGRSHADVFVSYQRQRELLLGACIALVVVGALALWWRSVAVRQREAARRALERSEVRLQFALEGAREVVWDWDMTTGAAYFSPRLVDITGQDQSDLPGRMADWAALIHPDDLRTVREAVRAHVQGKAERYACEYRVRGADGAWRWVSARGTAATRDGRGRTTRLTGVLSDITETRLAQDAEQSYRLRYDPLTGLINRGALLLEGTRLLSQNAAAPCWLLCIDLDRFTVLNDGLGHEAGNVVLQLVARRIQEVIGHDATVARMEANQFVVLLETAPHQDVVARTVHDLRKEIASPLTIGGEQYVQTCSIGIASSPADGQVIGELLSRARAAMRRAKGMGGNHAQFYTEALNERTVERLNLEKALRLALVNGELSLQFQPQVEMASSRIVGAEALLRWQHPELGMVPPDRFIPIAEETGMIGEIGQWVLRQACACARQWRDAGYVGIRVSVNLSGYQFRDVDLVEQIAEILHETGLPSALLDLEITESVVIDDLPAALRTMWRLKLMGITLSLDDFGTGYSSLSYLRQLPIDTLKIDRSFIGHVASDTRVAAITTAILTMARDLGLATVAEGVELATQIEFLQQRHCDLVQGYYFSRPIAHALFMQRLATEGQILPAGAPG